MIKFEPALKKGGSPERRKGSFSPYRLTKRKGLDEAHTVNLLLLENDDSEPVSNTTYSSRTWDGYFTIPPVHTARNISA